MSISLKSFTKQGSQLGEQSQERKEVVSIETVFSYFIEAILCDVNQEKNSYGLRAQVRFSVKLYFIVEALLLGTNSGLWFFVNSSKHCKYTNLKVMY